ncbi:MAG: heavy-metal-associated domain-containing protein [Anaerovoracaceae bacterium]
MGKVLFQIRPLRCPGCGKEIEDKLLGLCGVLSAKVLPKIGRVRTEFDETKTDAEHLEKTIDGWGYAVKLKELEKEDPK